MDIEFEFVQNGKRKKTTRHIIPESQVREFALKIDYSRLCAEAVASMEQREERKSFFGWKNKK